MSQSKSARARGRAATRPAFGSVILRLLALTVAVGISLGVYGARERLEQVATFGYPGIFLIALLANATVFLPAPGTAVVFAMGSVFNPLAVAFAAGSGGALGELTGYMAGLGGQAAVERTGAYARILPWVQKYGGWAILVLGAIPNPIFDLAGIAAGVTRLPLRRFLMFCWIGQCIKMTMFALAGDLSIPWLARLMQ